MTDPSEIGALALRAGSGSISGVMPAGCAVSRLLSGLCGIVSRTEKEFIDDGSPESLHDYRIAVRRTRSLLARLHGVVPEADLSHYREGFSSIMDKTATLRDLEVCRVMLAGYIEKQSDRISPLYDHVSKLEQRERRGLKRYLQAKQYREFTSAWAAYLQALAEDGSFEHNLTRPAGNLAHEAIQARYLKALEHASRLHSGASSKKFHKMRKAVKKLRYLVDLFSDLYPGKMVNKVRKRLKKVQIRLGDIQDLEVQSRLIRQAAGEMIRLDGKDRKAVEALLKKMKKQKQTLKRDTTGLVEKFPRNPGARIEQLLARRSCAFSSRSAELQLGIIHDMDNNGGRWQRPTSSFSGLHFTNSRQENSEHARERNMPEDDIGREIC